MCTCVVRLASVKFIVNSYTVIVRDYLVSLIQGYCDCFLLVALRIVSWHRIHVLLLQMSVMGKMRPAGMWDSAGCWCDKMC